MVQRKPHKSRKTAKDTPGKPRLAPGTRSPLDGPPPSVPATAAPAVKSDAKESTEVPAVDPIKQRWYRRPDSKTRPLCDKIATMDAAGRPDDYIAKKLGTTVGSIRQYRFIARKNGWWDANDEPVDIELEMALDVDHKIVRNISASLDGQMTNWQTHEMTIAAAKGRGHFKNYEANKGGEQTTGMIGIQIVMAPLGESDQKVEIPDSMCGGRPAFVDGEVSDGTPAGGLLSGIVGDAGTHTGEQA